MAKRLSSSDSLSGQEARSGRPSARGSHTRRTADALRAGARHRVKWWKQPWFQSLAERSVPPRCAASSVYVDGFNLYCGALEGTPFKWLDPVRLAALLLPREFAIDGLRYFTARVSGKVAPQASARQRVCLKALATLPEVEIHYGRFLAKMAWRPMANLPVAGRRIETPAPGVLPEGQPSGASDRAPGHCRPYRSLLS